MTLQNGDYCLAVRTADGSRTAMGPLVSMASGGYCVKGRTADGQIVAAGLFTLNAAEQIGVIARTADDLQVGLTPRVYPACAWKIRPGTGVEWAYSCEFGCNHVSPCNNGNSVLTIMGTRLVNSSGGLLWTSSAGGISAIETPQGIVSSEGAVYSGFYNPAASFPTMTLLNAVTGEVVYKRNLGKRMYYGGGGWLYYEVSALLSPMIAGILPNGKVLVRGSLSSANEISAWGYATVALLDMSVANPPQGVTQLLTPPFSRRLSFATMGQSIGVGFAVVAGDGFVAGVSGQAHYVYYFPDNWWNTTDLNWHGLLAWNSDGVIINGVDNYYQMTKWANTGGGPYNTFYEAWNDLYNHRKAARLPSGDLVVWGAYPSGSGLTIVSPDCSPGESHPIAESAYTGVGRGMDCDSEGRVYLIVGRQLVRKVFAGGEWTTDWTWNLSDGITETGVISDVCCCSDGTILVGGAPSKTWQRNA
jgi:hypothetical protein